ncbi:HK97-gp10 family putative phage morphogenesis protein [Novosphingobium sp. fls2-241-R2A-195]|uniref:HK97-gp10 family putative phage morphogenesis protein n=1 Tax=Novosphingobium sp. fls2-241-R2A-195 TaxID=3040296 RepID=UPI00254EB2ED|nr:HK97-gp10 family putative phage morphogenesis protein [Novosphingobium sp. fls2-241-R2A-195]
MAAPMSMKVSGLQELETALMGLKDRATSRRVADRALRKGAEPIRDRAKELAPDDPDTGEGKYLVEAIKIGRAAGIQQKLGNSGSVVTTFVGIDGSVKPAKPSTKRFTKKGTGKPGGGVAAYSIFMEEGSATHSAQPYIRPAFEEKKEEAVENMADILREEILETQARAARKAARNAG